MTSTRRRRRDLFAREVRRRWWRFWVTGVVALAAAVGVPAGLMASFHRDADLRAEGRRETALVVDYKERYYGRGGTERILTVLVGGRRVEIDPGPTDPDVGEKIDVVVGPGDNGRVLVAESPFGPVGARVFAALAGAGASAFLLFLGWGFAQPRIVALRHLREPAAATSRVTARVVSASRRAPPQGRLWYWVHLPGGRFYLVVLSTEAGREIGWHGQAPARPEPGARVTVIGGEAPGEWAALLHGSSSTHRLRVLWPVAPLEEVPR